MADFQMMIVNDALEGRIPVGKSKHGDVPDLVTLTLPGKTLYDLQRFLEAEAVKGGDWFRVRWLVLTHEDIRHALGNASKSIKVRRSQCSRSIADTSEAARTAPKDGNTGAVVARSGRTGS